MKALAAADCLPIQFRSEVGATDPDAVRAVVHSTGFFSAAEVAVAAELVRERLAKGEASGYRFLFAERGGLMLGYTCFGLIPLTRSSHDLYWIVVHPHSQGAGLGRQLLAMTERAIATAGGTVVYAETSSRPQYEPTRAFYLKCGYRIAAEIADFYAPGDGKVVFEKRLTPQ